MVGPVAWPRFGETGDMVDAISPQADQADGTRSGVMYRQGDVLVRAVERLPEGCTEVARDDGRIILAYGEVSGHAHAIDAPPEGATMLSPGGNRRFLQLVREVVVSHEEHAVITLPPGLYEVIRQREWSDSAELDERLSHYVGD